MKNNYYFRRHFSLFIAIIIGFVMGPVNAAIFMEIPGIPGESVDANHDGWIDVLSAGGSFTQNSCGDFVVTKEIDKAFPLLVASVVSGRIFSNIRVDFTAIFGGSRAVFSTITLDGASITSISTSASGNDIAGPPVESITIEASSIDIKYTQYDSEGNNLGTSIETVICGKSKDK